MKKLLLVLMLLAASGSALAQRVTSLEYWFDGNYALKQSKSVNAAGSLASIVESLDVPTLNNGFHTLSIRFSDNNNKWSSVVDRTFFKAEAAASTSTSIVAVEYWVDGLRVNSTKKSLTAFNGILVDQLDLPSLNNGMHTLSIRFLDNNNLWTGTKDYVFFKAGSTADAEFLVTKMRYWFDNDSTQIIEVSMPKAASIIDLQQYIDLKSPSPDLFPQLFSIQFGDNSGLWSAVYTKTFVPEPSFEAYQYLNTISFRNTSSFSRSFRWNFGDGTTDTTVNPTHTYKQPGVYTVTLQATNKLGTRDSFDVIQVRGLREVVSNRAGNAGDASILVYGAGFARDAKVWLEGPTTIQADTSYIERMDAMYARFDLRSKPLGVYDVAVQFPGDTVMRLLKSFTIEAATAAQPFVSVDGRNRILFGRWQSYQMNIGNSGNVDASGVPLLMVVSKSDGLELDFRNLNIAVSASTAASGLSYLLDSVPNRFEIDELFGEPFEGYVYVFYIPNIPANSSRTLELKIKTNQSFKLYTWMNAPYFQSPFDDAVASCINEAIAWYAMEKGLDLGLKFIPGAGCLKNIGKESYGMMSRVIERKIGKDSDGKPYKTWGEWAWGWGNWAVDMTAIGVGCAMDVFPPTKAAKFAYASYKTIIELNKIKKDVRKLASADAKCREKFKHLSKKDQYVAAVSSFDPNEMVGPHGYTAQRFTHNQGSYDYSIFFENKSSASAAAQEVIILDTLDKKVFDLSSFTFGSFSYGATVTHPLSTISHFTINIDSVRNKAEMLRVNASIDTATGIVRWQFITLNPATMDYPEDPDAGFLPPNVNAPEGEGCVRFSVKLKSNLPENVAIVNRAKIIFDLNQPIYTNTYSNALDLSAPQSQLTEVRTTATPYLYRFHVSAQDALSGVRYVTLYGSRNDSAYIPLMLSAQTTFLYQCEPGVQYKFFSIASDSVGNEEAMKTKAEQSSQTVDVPEEFSASRIDELDVSPNPASTMLYLRYSARSAGVVELSVINPIANTLISTLQEYSDVGLNRKAISIEHLPNGVYYLQLSCNDAVRSKKFVVLH